MSVSYAEKPARAKKEPLVKRDGPERPDFKKLQTNIDNIKKEIKVFTDQIEEIKKKQDAEKTNRNDPRKELRDQRQKLVTDKKKLMTEVQKLRDSQNAVYQASRELRDETRKQEREVRDLNKEIGDILTPEALDKKVKELEFKIETGGCGGIKGEKRVMTEIKQLKEKRSKVEEIYKKLSSMELSREATSTSGADETLPEQIASKRAEITDLIEKIKAVEDTIDNMVVEDKYKALRAERDVIHAKIDDKYKKMNTLRDQFTADKKAYDDYEVIYKAQLDEAWKIKRAKDDEEHARRKEKNAENELILASIRRRNPYEAEINSCTTLIGFLRGNNVLHQEKKVAPKTTFTPADNLKGMVLMKKDEDDGALSFGKKKKAAPAKKAHEAPKERKVDKTPKPFKVSAEKFEAFEKLGVKTPTNTEEVRVVLAELQKKREEYESHKLTEKEAMALEQAERNAAKKEDDKKADEKADEEEEE